MAVRVTAPSSAALDWSCVKGSMLLAMLRATFILLHECTNETSKQLNALLSNVEARIHGGIGTCECLLTARGCYTTQEACYEYVVNRLRSRRTKRRRIVVDCAAEGSELRTGSELVKLLYKNLSTALTGTAVSTGGLKELCQLAATAENVDVIFVLPLSTEYILFKPAYDYVNLKASEQALLYTLLDIVNNDRRQLHSTWSVLIFVSSPTFLELASHKVQSRIGCQLRNMGNSLTLAEAEEFLMCLKRYAVAAAYSLAKKHTRGASPVGIFIGDYFDAMLTAVKQFATTSVKNFTLDTVPLSWLLKRTQDALASVLKYDPLSGECVQPDQSYTALAYPSLAVARGGPDQVDQASQWGSNNGSPDMSTVKPAKRTSLMTPIVPTRRPGLRSRDDLTSLDPHAENKLRLLFWRRLPLIDVCVLLAWLNCHTNEGLTYITCCHLQERCQPYQLSATDINTIHFSRSAIVASLHFLLRTKILLLSQAQILTDTPETATAAVEEQETPFMSQPVIFPQWTLFQRFLETVVKTLPADYPSWLAVRTDGHLR